MAKRKTAAARRAQARKRAAAQAQAERKTQQHRDPEAERGPSRREEREAAREAQQEVLDARRKLLNRLELVTFAGAVVAGVVWVFENFEKSAYNDAPWLRPTLVGLLLAFVLASMAFGLYVTVRDRAVWWWKVLVVVPLSTIPGSFYYAVLAKRELDQFVKGARTASGGSPSGARARSGAAGDARGAAAGGARGGHTSARGGAGGSAAGSRGAGGGGSGRAQGGKDVRPAGGGGRRQSVPPDKIKLLGDR